MTINNKDVSVGDKVKIITPKEEVEGTLLEVLIQVLFLLNLSLGII